MIYKLKDTDKIEVEAGRLRFMEQFANDVKAFYVANLLRVEYPAAFEELLKEGK